MERVTLSYKPPRLGKSLEMLNFLWIFTEKSPVIAHILYNHCNFSVDFSFQITHKRQCKRGSLSLSEPLSIVWAEFTK